MKNFLRTVLGFMFVIHLSADAFEEIYSASKEIEKLDKESLLVPMRELKDNPDDRPLFGKVTQEIPQSYIKTNQLAALFNPETNTNDHKKLEPEIDNYLKYLENHPVIRYALDITQTGIEDLKKNWFGTGRGFEHTIAGETKSSTVSGYHWWYRYYVHQNQKTVKYLKSFEGMEDPGIFTGSFKWDPDGNGPMKECFKKKGGFLVGNSAPFILALGHIAIETKKKYNIGGATMKFRGQFQRKNYVFQMYLQDNNIRSVYPMVERGAGTENENFEKLYVE